VSQQCADQDGRVNKSHPAIIYSTSRPFVMGTSVQKAIHPNLLAEVKAANNSVSYNDHSYVCSEAGEKPMPSAKTARIKKISLPVNTSR
jgi:hypothetical protein